jgi:two-component system chemotaxis response regulator CheY
MSYPQSILLTDDEAHIRKFISLVLRKYDNPRILEASDGAQALALYKEHRPDMVLMDVNMPNMDGLQALGQIRQHDPDAIVVMLTSLTNRQTVEECVRLGATDYIRKDTPREELSARFEEIIADCFGPGNTEAAAP